MQMWKNDSSTAVGGVGICPVCGKKYDDVTIHDCRKVYPEATPSAWICPKCGYVWAWYVSGCENRNQLKTICETTATWFRDSNQTSGR